MDEIHFYIKQDNEPAANKMLGKIINSMEGLLTFPFIGSVVNDKLRIKGEYRTIIVSPYIIFYRVLKKEVVIYRVLHSKRYHAALFEQ